MFIRPLFSIWKSSIGNQCNRATVSHTKRVKDNCPPLKESIDLSFGATTTTGCPSTVTVIYDPSQVGLTPFYVYCQILIIFLVFTCLQVSSSNRFSLHNCYIDRSLVPPFLLEGTLIVLCSTSVRLSLSVSYLPGQPSGPAFRAILPGLSSRPTFQTRTYKP